MNTKPTISVIIIVKNDRGIANTLAGLAVQTKPAPTETIVVDASDPARLADIRAQYSGPEVAWYSFEPAVPKKTSIPEQRNFGIRHTQGDIIVFIDANCVPSENWLVELTKPLLDGSETMTAGSARAARAKTYVNLNREDDQSVYLTTSPTLNLAFKKELWESVGGFDESFLFGSDVDFTWRCSEAGNKILFVRQAFVTHDWGTFRDEIKRSFRYGKARARLLMKHPKLFHELFGANSYILAYTIYLLLLPLTFYFWWYPLVIGLAFLKNIGDKPFKKVFLNIIYTLGVWFEFLQTPIPVRLRLPFFSQ